MKLTDGAAIMLEFPNHLFAEKKQGATPLFPFPDTGKYRNLIPDFIVMRLAPDTIIGNTRHVLIKEQKLQELCDLRRAYTDQTEPDFIDFLKQIVDDGVRFLPEYQRKTTGSNRDKWFFSLNLIVKLSNAEYETQVPVGISNYAEETTWKQLVDGGLFTVIHSNTTHKFIYYTPRATHEQFKALFDHLDVQTDRTKFDVLSVSELNAQKEADSE